jgi:hypothetical protein
MARSVNLEARERERERERGPSPEVEQAVIDWEVSQSRAQMRAAAIRRAPW